MRTTRMAASMDDLQVVFDPNRQRYDIRANGQLLTLDVMDAIMLRHILGFLIGTEDD